MRAEDSDVLVLVSMSYSNHTACVCDPGQILAWDQPFIRNEKLFLIEAAIFLCLILWEG